MSPCDLCHILNLKIHIVLDDKIIVIYEKNHTMNWIKLIIYLK